MNSKEIREKFLKFFEDKGHTIVPSSSLVPEDPSVLLTTAGMQQFKSYYGELDPDKTIHSNLGKPVGKNAVSIQKSFRTSDIDEVGDESHLTFFEMMGNFSFGGYFKEKAIELAHEFLTKELGLKISYVTVFEGNNSIGVPEDKDSAAIWQKIDPSIRIEKQGMEDVFWGPTGNSGPCGPTTEVYFENAQGQDVETWNLVFNEYFYPGSREELLSGVSEKKLEKLKTPGVDTGMGLERIMMAVQNTKNIFETDLFTVPFPNLIEGVDVKSYRIIADHLRGSVFLIADGVKVSNKGAGYILRRLIRRTIVQAKTVSLPAEALEVLFNNAIDFYGGFYKGLLDQKNNILSIFLEEQKRFNKTLDVGLKEFLKKYPELEAQFIEPGKPLKVHQANKISGEDAFYFHQTYGFTLDTIRDLARRGLHEIDIDEKAFEEAFKKHQEISRAGIERKFGGHGLLLDTGELKAADEEELKKVTRLHTATHMLQAALRQVLGPEVHQMGSDITAERLRFDFTFPRKVTPEEISSVEDLINQKIKEDLTMNMIEMPIEEAKASGALTVERAKYAPIVKVYSIENFSKEVCGGPHVTHTGEVGNIKIIKEEASSAGVRRIRAQVAD